MCVCGGGGGYVNVCVVHVCFVGVVRVFLIFLFVCMCARP